MVRFSIVFVYLGKLAFLTIILNLLIILARENTTMTPVMLSMTYDIGWFSLLLWNYSEFYRELNKEK